MGVTNTESHQIPRNGAFCCDRMGLCVVNSLRGSRRGLDV